MQFLLFSTRFQLDWKVINLLLRLLLSFIAGFIIGFEREKSGHPAGLKTHILVSIGACLIAIVSIEAFEGGDPARLAAQVVSGIGFIGAGAIMRDNSGGIKGITTAATLWITACIGLGFGSGMFLYTIIGLLLVTATLIFVKKIENKIIRKNCIITLTCDSNQKISDVVIGTFYENDIAIKTLVINPLSNQNNSSRVIITIPANSNIESKIKKAISLISEKLNIQSLHVKNMIQHNNEH